MLYSINRRERRDALLPVGYFGALHVELSTRAHLLPRLGQLQLQRRCGEE